MKRTEGKVVIVTGGALGIVSETCLFWQKKVQK